MARDARWVIRETFAQLKDEVVKDGQQEATLSLIDRIEKRLTFTLDVAGIRQTPGPRAAKAADGKKD